MAQKKDMTKGKITLPLIAFTVPLVLGNLFQLTYNAADSVIVGYFVGEEALAAVGTSAPLMNIALLLISGLCMGASILMSAQYGSGCCPGRSAPHFLRAADSPFFFPL